MLYFWKGYILFSGTRLGSRFFYLFAVTWKISSSFATLLFSRLSRINLKAIFSESQQLPAIDGKQLAKAKFQINNLERW